MPRFWTVAIVSLFCLATAAAAFGDIPDGGPPDATAVTASEEAGPAPTEPPGVNAPGTVDDLAQGVRVGNWRLVAAFVVFGVAYGLRKARDRVKWLKGDRGGALLAFLLALAVTLIASLKADAPLDAKMLVGALGITFTAVGGYTWVRRLIWPADKPPAEAAAGAGV